MHCIERNVSNIERIIQIVFALIFSASMFSLALFMPFFWQGFIGLTAAIVSCELLYMVAFWPKIEQVVGQNRSKLSINVSSNQRGNAYKQAFIMSGCQDLMMLVVWVMLQAHLIGVVLLLAVVITNVLLWRKFRFNKCDANPGVKECRVIGY